MQRAKKRTFFKSKKAPDELRDWSFTSEQIGHQLKKYYQARITEELPPRLLAVIKKLDEEHSEN
jgi:hypothetical protein